MTDVKKQVLFMAGPTASGKSALALKIAEHIPSVIINADSMQVYKELDIISARPSLADCAQAPHRLYGHVSACHAYSAVEWTGEALSAVASAKKEGRLPILVGGTGLYFNSLLRGMAVIPPISDAVRARIRAKIAKDGSADSHAYLALIDPQMAARLEHGDSQRIARALEVFEATGRSLADFQAETPPGPLAGQALLLKLENDRAWLYERINRRFVQMIEAGALPEIKALMAYDYDPNLPALKALGVPELMAHLKDRISLDEAIERAQQQTRRFAKRQMTWFRNQFHDWQAVETVAPAQALERVFALLRAEGLT